jgi:hypothetical protein
LFIAVEAVSVASPATANMLAYFTVLELKTDEYLELVEATRMME